MPPIQTLLLPTDFSESSRGAFQLACSLAREHNATLVLLHVMIPSSAPFAGPVPNPMQPAEAQASLKGRFPWPEPEAPGVVIEHRIAEGDVAAEILRMAGAIGADLIVMGTSGRTGLARLLLGSVAEEVLRRASCPVMVIKTAFDAPRLGEKSAGPGQVIDVRPLAAGLAASRSRLLVKTAEVEVSRLVLPAGKELAAHTAKGLLLLQCLEGKVLLTAGASQTLHGGEMLYLPAGQSHSLRAIEDASLLLTVLQPKR